MRKLLKKENVYLNIFKNGYYEFNNPHVSKKDYQKVYNCFNHLIPLISKDRLLNQTVINAEKDFQASYGSIFCNAPSGYRDCNSILDKRDQKQYFQYSNEHHKLLREKYTSILEQFGFYRLFLEYLEKIDKESKIILNRAIDTLENDIPGLKKALFGKRKELTVIIKVIRYQNNNKLCTSPHYDKSGLTLVLDNDDIKNDRFIIGPYMEQFNPTNLSPTKQSHHLNKKSTSAYLFPGACLKKIGLPLNPIPHAVLPAKTSFRHSIIAFCLVPNLDTNDIQTVILEKDKFTYS